MSNNITKIPSPIHTITRPVPIYIVISKCVSHYLGQTDSLVFRVVVVDVGLVESDAFNPRQSDLDVLTDVIDVFQTTEAVISAIRVHSHLCWMMDTGFCRYPVSNKTKEFHRKGKPNHLQSIPIISNRLSVGSEISNIGTHFHEPFHIWKHRISIS